MVDEHRFVVALLTETELILEAGTLVDGVIELGVSIGYLLTIDHELEALGEAWVRAVLLRQRGHLLRIVGDEGRLYIGTFALLTEDLIDHLTYTHRLIGFDAELLAGST